jgi:hypothetical protein
MAAVMIILNVTGPAVQARAGSSLLARATTGDLRRV